MRKPLEGYRILDLTSNISGPFSTMILADMGAEVIKIERIDAGDDSRQMTPHFGEWSAYFIGINRNKKSLAVNFKKNEGLEVIYKLAATCDVVVQNFRGGKAEQLGLGYSDFKGVREDIIYCDISAYGQKGPLKGFPGYDALVQAQTGILSINGSSSEELSRVGVSLLDMGSGMWAAIGILSALLQKKESGQGQFVATSLYETGTMWALYHLLYYQALGRNPEPQGTRHTAFAPYGAYETLDGQVFIGISNDRLFSKLCTVLEKREWAEDPRFRLNSVRLQHRAELEAGINEVLRGKTAGQWLQDFEREGIPASEVKRISDVLSDPHLETLGQMGEVMVEGHGSVRIPKLPLQLEQSYFSDLKPAPRLGQNTEEIMQGLGYSTAQISRLHQEGIIFINTAEKGA